MGSSMFEMKLFIHRLGAVSQKHSEYKKESYDFVLAALNFAIEKMPKPRHVTGQEFCQSIRDYALEQFGPMARNVLEYWGITQTYDFGKIVFYLIEGGLMSKTDDDTLEDFRDVYDFDAVFSRGIEYDI